MIPRFLIVDDEPLILWITSDFLSGIAGGIVQASNAREAISAFTTGDFDILITDRFMPGMDGIALSRLLKTKHPTLKVILISGVAGKLSFPIHGGPDLFLPKPFTQEQLLESVRQVLALSEAVPS